MSKNMDKLNWVNNSIFFDKTLWAPFHLEKDIMYLDDLRYRYNLLYKKAELSGADPESLNIIEHKSKKIIEAINSYYKGRISTSHEKIKNLIRELINEPLAVNSLYNSKAFLGVSREIQFFRARTSDHVTTYSPQDMLHIPFEQRGKTGNYRFSIPGIPSFYIGNTTYACWLELGCVPEYMLNVSPVLLDGTQKILNLAVMTRALIMLNDFEPNFVHCWLKLLILMIATSYVIDEQSRIFKSEYIVSQSIMLACKELGLNGVAYFSKRVSDEVFAFTAVNVALFTDYKKGKSYSSICEHVKVDNSFNYSVYKQLGIEDRNPEYDELRVQHIFGKTQIGTYSRKFSYLNTDFCSFDKFLFANWKNKDDISFGNALKDKESNPSVLPYGLDKKEFPIF